MSIYTSKKVILPSKIDELGLQLSLTRLPEEDVESLKKRILLESRDPVNNSEESILKTFGRNINKNEIPVFRLKRKTGSTGLEKVKVTSSKIYVWNDYVESPVLEKELSVRSETYFLSDLFDTLDALSLFDIDTLQTEADYWKSGNLMICDSLKTEIFTLQATYVNTSRISYAKKFRFTDSIVYKTEVDTLEEVSTSGDYFIDYEYGNIHSYELGNGICYIEYERFPFTLYWQPVRGFPLNDQDIDYLIKDKTMLDSGLFPTDLNSEGTRWINELLEVHPLQWGS